VNKKVSTKSNEAAASHLGESLEDNPHDATADIGKQPAVSAQQSTSPAPPAEPTEPYEHEELLRLGIHPLEIESQLGDYIDDLENLRRYVAGLHSRPELLPKDIEWAEAIQKSVARLDEWHQLTFERE